MAYLSNFLMDYYPFASSLVPCACNSAIAEADDGHKYIQITPTKIHFTQKPEAESTLAEVSRFLEMHIEHLNSRQLHEIHRRLELKWPLREEHRKIDPELAKRMLVKTAFADFTHINTLEDLLNNTLLDRIVQAMDGNRWREAAQAIKDFPSPMIASAAMHLFVNKFDLTLTETNALEDLSKKSPAATLENIVKALTRTSGPHLHSTIKRLLMNVAAENQNVAIILARDLQFGNENILIENLRKGFLISPCNWANIREYILERVYGLDPKDQKLIVLFDQLRYMPNSGSTLGRLIELGLVKGADFMSVVFSLMDEV